MAAQLFPQPALEEIKSNTQPIPVAKRKDDEWSEVKEKKTEKTEKRDAYIYKVAPSKPQTNPAIKPKNTTT